MTFSEYIKESVAVMVSDLLHVKNMLDRIYRDFEALERMLRKHENSTEVQRQDENSSVFHSG